MLNEISQREENNSNYKIQNQENLISGDCVRVLVTLGREDIQGILGAGNQPCLGLGAGYMGIHSLAFH